ncbi:Glycosyl hydrolase family 115 [Lachnospiraceae bacterium NE2001]|nr:Glycosyl hydrolase family 115 [Lachnospiraceae bacterium NE2001]
MIINKDSSIRFIYENSTLSGVKKISELVMKDVEMVTDSHPVSATWEETSYSSATKSEDTSYQNATNSVDIIFGTIGNSPMLDLLVEKGEITFDGIEGKREVYGFFPLDNRIVIVGSDKRGTIYGLFHISDLLGVSPQVNWSLAVPAKKSLHITEADRFISKEPSVRYRGFFINDEWPCFGTWCNKHFGGFTVGAYEGIFEMLLRMKGNYLWPAMWSSCFAEDGPGLASAELADEMGVVMGLSHHEPCLRHGEEYSHVRGKDSIYGDAWNFRTNPDGITRFWRDGLKRNGHLENVITVGMRGERDSKIMGKDATLKENIDLLRDVLRTQNQLIKEEVNSDITKVPRMLALYKEVEPFYYGDETTEGLISSDDLDDVILMLCDDNHGYVRSLPTEEMRRHKGGFGMYYHFDYHGEPVSYEWINSTYLPEVWEQMTTAYEHGIRDLWIVNVGDLGLNEMPLSYFLSLAYDYDKYGITSPNETKKYLRDWMEKAFGAAFSSEDIDLLTDTYNRYTRLVHNRRPEHMNEMAYPLEGYKAESVLRETEDIKRIILELENRCPEDSKAAFTELISYNALAGMNLIEMWIYKAYNHFFASIGAVVANTYADKIKECLDKDAELADKLGTVADGKWDGFQLAEHIGFRNWNSELSARPILETIIPVKGPTLMAGLTGTTDSNSGMEWSKKVLTVNNWRTSDNDTFETRVFVASTGDTAVSFEALLSDGADEKEPERNYIAANDDLDISDSLIKKLGNWDIEIDKTSGTVGPDNLIEYITIKASRDTLEKLSDKTDIHLYISYANGKVDIRLLGFRKDLIEIAAEDYTTKKDEADSDDSDSQDGKRFVTLEDVGSWDSGVKLFPVISDSLLSDDTPYLEYEFNVEEAGDYRLIFQVLPANPFTFGHNIFIRYSVNSEDVKDVEEIRLLPDDYQAGISEEWGDGVLTHIRRPEVLIHLNQGNNKVRFYAASRENVLEKLIIEKYIPDTGIPKRIYG